MNICSLFANVVTGFVEAGPGSATPATILALAPDVFLVNGKAWIEATFGVLEMFVAKAGVLALAIVAVYQNVKSKVVPLLQERMEQLEARQDRQSDRIHKVAIAAQVPIEKATIEAEHVTVEEKPLTSRG